MPKIVLTVIGLLLLWAVIHGLLSWIYVVYYALVYHFK